MALELAERENGIVVNADSMQVYSVLDVLTARPGAGDLDRAPHALYGHVDPALAYSTGAWLRDVGRLVAGGGLAGRRPVFVGGTGLYFKALIEGLSAMPEIPDEMRQRWRGRLADEGAAGLHRLLAERDAEAARAIRPEDGQRIARALEVLEVSGRSIRSWQSERGSPLVDAAAARKVVIEPPRDVLAGRIASRFAAMLRAGAVGEVEALLAMRLDPSMPAMKAIGVRELAQAIEGRISFEEAGQLAIVATRRFAKRQSTWFRHQLDPSWLRVQSPIS